MCALKVEVLSQETFATSIDKVRSKLKPNVQKLFDLAIKDLPRLSLEYYIYNSKGDSQAVKERIASLKEVVTLLAAGDEEIIFNTQQNFFHNKSAIRIIADYWAIIREIDYVKNHTDKDLAIQYDYPTFMALLDNLPWQTNLALLWTVTLNSLKH